jgi:hypothetical protein
MFAAIAMLGAYRCPIHLAFGIPCPTCGITRATRLALMGDVSGATHLHPLVWVAVPVTALLLGLEIAGHLRTGRWGASRRMRGSRLLSVLMVGTAALLFVLWIARFFGAFGGPVV